MPGLYKSVSSIAQPFGTKDFGVCGKAYSILVNFSNLLTVFYTSEMHKNLRHGKSIANLALSYICNKT